MNFLKASMMNSLKEHLEGIPKKVVLLTNKRKVLLTSIYKNLEIQLKGYVEEVNSYDVNDLKPGFLTNPLSRDFMEPEHVFVLLTKKHNARQLRILEELNYHNTAYTLISLGINYKTKRTYYKIKDVKALYTFMYNLTCIPKHITYTEFAKNYSWFEE